MIEQLMYLFLSISMIIVSIGCLGAGIWLVVRYGGMLLELDHVTKQCVPMIILGAILIIAGIIVIA